MTPTEQIADTGFCAPAVRVDTSVLVPVTSPLPWRGAAQGLVSADNQSVAIMVPRLELPDFVGSRANAAFIVRAANNHDDLLAAAKLALMVAEGWIHDQLDGTSDLESSLADLEPVRAAIAKAEG